MWCSNRLASLRKSEEIPGAQRNRNPRRLKIKLSLLKSKPNSLKSRNKNSSRIIKKSAQQKMRRRKKGRVRMRQSRQMK